MTDSAGRVYTTTTSASGDYVFNNLPAGTYTVTVTDNFGILNGYIPTVLGDPTLDNHNKTTTFTVVLGAGQDNLIADFGYILPGIVISKTPDVQQVLVGGTATFNIVITNTSAIDLENVTTTDPLASNCSQVIGGLIAGGTASYTCSVSPVNADFTNVITVTGTPVTGGPPVSDSDDALVDVINPAIVIAKTPDLQQVVSGGTVTFTIVVTNTGDTYLSSVAVTDPLAQGCDRTIGLLAPNVPYSYTCTRAGVTGDFTNVAIVTGQPSSPTGTPIPGTTPISAQDTALVDVIGPSITVLKSPDLQQIVSGGTATWTIVVSNTGDVTLSNVAVSDPQASNCNNPTIGTLAPNQGISYTCSRTGITGDFTNIATATGTPPVGPPISSSDPADVDVVNPAVVIAKTPDLQQIPSGGTASFTIVVTNTGDTYLTNVAVTDALAPNCNRTIGLLAPNVPYSYTCTRAGVTGDFTNVAIVTGQPSSPTGTPIPGTTPIQAQDNAVVDVIGPAVAIAKTPDLQQVVSGGTASFTIVVTNTGDTYLANVTVNDPLATNCNRTIGLLAPNQVYSYTCTRAGVIADYTNVATVTGQPSSPNGTPIPGVPPVTAQDDAVVDVVNPRIVIAKTPDLQQVVSGGTASFTIVVTNTGDTYLANVTVSDTLAPDCNRTIGMLAPNAPFSFTCARTGVTADFTNVAIVTGQPSSPTGTPIPGTTPIQAQDNAVVDVVNPSVVIAKTPDPQQIPSGGTATWTIVVTNSGDTYLANVSVSDPQASNCNRTIGLLAPGQQYSYTCSRTGVTADFTNVATVTGTPSDPNGTAIPGAPPVTNQDSALVDVINPAIVIAKTPDLQQIPSGGTATFNILVTNSGDTYLANVTVNDPLATNCNRTIGLLAPGQQYSYTCTRHRHHRRLHQRRHGRRPAQRPERHTAAGRAAGSGARHRGRRRGRSQHHDRQDA